MGYETKVLLIAIGRLVRAASSVEAAYDAVAELANVEGVILKPWGYFGDDDKEGE